MRIQRAVLGIEPRTSRTLSENHTTRPNSQLFLSLPLSFIGFTSLTRTHTIRPTRNQKMVRGATCLRMDDACDALSLKLSNIFVHICLHACHGYSNVIPAKASRVVTDGLEALCPKIMFFSFFPNRAMTVPVESFQAFPMDYLAKDWAQTQL